MEKCYKKIQTKPCSFCLYQISKHYCIKIINWTAFFFYEGVRLSTNCDNRDKEPKNKIKRKIAWLIEF